MSQRKFTLQNSSYAFVSSEDAVHLLEQKDRLEQAVINEDAPLTLDTAKSLLESIFKTILNDRTVTPNLTQDFKPLYRNVRDVMPFNQNGDANSLLGNLGSAIVHNVAELRNKFGAASHGDDGYFETPIQMNDAEMVAHVVDGLAGFMYRKHKLLIEPESAQRVYYSDYPEFNSYLDGQYSGYKLELGERGGIDLPTSEIIFLTDRALYREMLIQFRSTEEVDSFDTTFEAEPEVLLDEQSISAVFPQADDLSKVEEEESFDPILDITSALCTNGATNFKVTRDEATDIAEFVQDYALNRAGVDWDKRDSLIAKFRIRLKRILIRYEYSETHINDVVEMLISKAKENYPSDGTES
jgi:hypothetical protein